MIKGQDKDKSFIYDKKKERMPQAMYRDMITLSFGWKGVIFSMFVLMLSLNQGRLSVTEK
jgi:hypothetical protein